MIITPEEKRRLLIQRGFTPEEIDSGFRGLSKDDGSWRINTVSPEELRETYDLTDIRAVFQKDSQDGTLGSFPFPDDFTFYSSDRKAGDDISVSAGILEPFAARLVIACNKCGVFTYMSDDGWHEWSDGSPFRELIIWLRERYSTLWFWIIAEFIFDEKRQHGGPGARPSWKGIFEPTNRERWLNGRLENGYKVICRIPAGDEAKVYRRINGYACFMERYSEELCGIRDKWMAVLQEKMDGAEIDSMTTLDLRRIIIGAAWEELQLMSEKWHDMRTELNKRETEGIQAWDLTGPRYLNVPYEEKDEAKALGAKYDGAKKKWYISWETDPEPFSRWLKKKKLP